MKANFALFYMMRQACIRKRLASLGATAITNRRDGKWPNLTIPQQSVSEKLPSKRKRPRSARRNWASPQPTKVCGKISRRQPAKVRLPPEPDYLAATVLRIIQRFVRPGQDLPEAGIIPFEACLLGQHSDPVTRRPLSPRQSMSPHRRPDPLWGAEKSWLALAGMLRQDKGSTLHCIRVASPS